MTDKELLELAAKAAGIPVHELYDAIGDCGGIEKKGWDPFNDDGDALRLAVKLGLEVQPYFYHDERCQTPAIATQSGGMRTDIVGIFPKYAESHARYDPCAATRRAIVRAAAEIGRGM